MKILFKTLEDETVELDVLEKDLVVKIKQKIRDNLSYPHNINIKSLILKYKNNILNDNALLQSYDIKEGDFLTVEQNSELESRNNIILYFQGDMPERQILQFDYDTKIEQVKKILNSLLTIKKFDLYRHSEKLIDECTIKQQGLDDYTRINVVIDEHETDEQKKIKDELKKYFKGQPDVYFERKVQPRFRRPNDYLMLFYEETHLLNPFGCNKLKFEDTIIKPLRIKNVNIDKEPIDMGMYSEILMARDSEVNRSMVIKRYICEDNELITKYENLIHNMINFQKLNHNPRVVELYKFYRNDFSFGIGMEYMEGGSMDNYVKNFWPFPEKQIIRWIRSILEGLQYLHSNKIIFRDLKPSNILLDENNNLKLCSFSLGIYLMSNPEMELKQISVSSRMGLFNYTAPEVLNCEAYGFPADIWSFGGVLVNMITGKHPCPDDDPIDAVFRIARNLTMLYTLPESTNHIIKDVIDRCVTGNPILRPTIAELIEHYLAPLLA